MLFCLWAGGWWFIGLMGLCAAGLATEWRTLAGFAALSWPAGALTAATVAAVILTALDSPLAAAALLAAGCLAVLTVAPGPDGCAATPGGIAPDGCGTRGHAPGALTQEGTAPEAQAPGMAGLAWLRPGRRALAAGFPYLGAAAIALPWLRGGAAGWANTLFILCIVWASDIGAYVIGRLAGGPKLAPAISPGKTWSGAIGGLVSAAAAGLGVAACFTPGPSPVRVIVLSLFLGLLAQLGDLWESAVKRHFGVKDSGRMIPGHGGLLDRLDAVLAVAPAAALLACSVGRGVYLWR